MEMPIGAETVPTGLKNGFLTSSTTVSGGILSGKIIKEDTLECYSRNQAVYRLILTDSQLYLQSVKHPELFEQYSLEELFGVQTYRHKHKRNSTKEKLPSAYVCFTFYPKIKKGLIITSKLRERIQIVFKIQKHDFSFQQNLEVATSWKSTCFKLLRLKFSKWQVEKLENQVPLIENGNETLSETYSEENGNLVSNIDNLQPDEEAENNGNTIGATDELAVSISNEILWLRKFLVILNPKSGQGKTLSVFKNTVHPIFQESGINANLFVTEYPGHARSMVFSADLSDVHGIVTVGGDGLLYEVVNGLRSRADSKNYSSIPVGVIAGGSGNGLARSIASYSDESDEYLRNPVLQTALAIARGRVLPVNLLEVEVDTRKVYAFLSVGWGILADIDIESEVIRSIGESRFTLWSLLRVAKLRTYSAQINFSTKMDNGSSFVSEMNGDFVSVYASCQSHIGSDIIFAPGASPNDGLIHLTIAKGDIGRARVTQFLLGLDKGSHINVPGVEYFKVESFSIHCKGGISGTVTLDGEKVNGETVKVKLASEPLNVFAL